MTSTEAVRTITLDGVEVRTDTNVAIGLVWRGEPSEQCRKGQAGYVCTLDAATPHEHHVAGTAGGFVAHIWPNEDFDADAPELSEVDRYKQRVRTLAEEICRSRGYGDWAVWNETMQQLGIEQFTERKVRLVVPVTQDQVAYELGDVTEEYAQTWLEARRHRLADYVRVGQDALGEPQIEVEAQVPGDHIAADWRADTEDLDTYRELVREVAIELGRQQSWCDDGVNGVLDELGLDHIIRERDYTVRVDLIARQTVYLNYSARDADAAGDMVDRYAVREAISSSEWEWDGEWEIESINED